MTDNKRGAGILMHITSLPSPFGIGDLGVGARSFADFLHKSNQKYWQLLPLNPTEEGQGHSPYSSISSRAGNTLLISPEWLADNGLVTAAELQQYHLPATSTANYTEAARAKEEIFEIAWRNSLSNANKDLQKDFTKFSNKESGWLDDFAIYMLLKQQNENLPWFRWPAEFKLRNKKALHSLLSENKDSIEKLKWMQFIFSRQWQDLRSYCHHKGIKFFGDLPFYVSYDSVDVWSNRELFSIDEAGNMIGAAGVPPDAFSDDGQLWGMPVFLWDVLKKNHYSWWVERLRKNMELYDLLRLDHFRAFADYWEVPAESQTARNGKWVPGPGAGLFTTLKKELGELPFIAEDLGEINEAVHQLRNQFNFPGMKILQFAFGHEMPQSPYIPHNYSENFIAYTGTHDNNTVRGWYRQEGHKYNHQLQQYIGKPVSENDIYWEMARLVFASVACLAILPMQDVLDLDESARMNTPASAADNWKWRLLPEQVTYEVEHRLKELTGLYNRG